MIACRVTILTILSFNTVVINSFFDKFLFPKKFIAQHRLCLNPATYVNVVVEIYNYIAFENP